MGIVPPSPFQRLRRGDILCTSLTLTIFGATSVSVSVRCSVSVGMCSNGVVVMLALSLLVFCEGMIDACAAVQAGSTHVSCWILLCTVHHPSDIFGDRAAKSVSAFQDAQG